MSSRTLVVLLACAAAVGCQEPYVDATAKTTNPPAQDALANSSPERPMADPRLQVAFASAVDGFYPGNRNGGQRDPRPFAEVLAELRGLNPRQLEGLEEHLLSDKHPREVEFSTYQRIWPDRFRGFLLEGIKRGRKGLRIMLIEVAQPEDVPKILDGNGRIGDFLDPLANSEMFAPVLAFHRASPSPESAYVLGLFGEPEKEIRASVVSGRLRAAVLQGLASSDNPATIRMLEEFTMPPSETYLLAGRLTRTGEEAIRELGRWLASDDPPRRDLARRTLASMPSDRAVRLALESPIRNNDDFEVATNAGKNSPSEVARYVARAFAAEIPSEMAFAIALIDSSQPVDQAKLRSYLIKATKNSHAETRARAVSALTLLVPHNDPDQVRELLRILDAALRDPVEVVRSAAVYRTQTFSTPRMLKRVEELRDDPAQPPPLRDSARRCALEVRLNIETLRKQGIRLPDDW